MDQTEILRFRIQKELDSQKSQKERNVLGQFSTPYPLAEQICHYVSSLIGKEIESFLEPAIGTGVFYSALAETAKVKKALGFEIDPVYFNPAKEIWKNTNLEMINQDFLLSEPKEKVSLIISNPPYSRHHHVPVDYKKILQARIKSNYGIELSGLSGLYCYFIILSTLWLEEGGLSCWLVPSEFLSVNYGRGLKRFLLENVDLMAIHTFDNENTQFEDALVSSTILVFKNQKPLNRKIVFSYGNDINRPAHKCYASRNSLHPDAKWNSCLVSDGEKDSVQETIGSFFTIKRGIATGNNSYFIIKDKDISEYSLPYELLTSILPPPRSLNIDVIEEKEGVIDIPSPQYLISCSLEMDEIKIKYPGYHKYLMDGICRKVNEGSNCRNRTLWYQCEKRLPAPLLVSYMGRNNGRSTFRFILNNSNAVATNSYLMLYPKKEFSDCINDRITRYKIGEFLREIPSETMMSHGRSYGGGLFKIEPKELASVPCKGLGKIMKPNQPSLFDI